MPYKDIEERRRVSREYAARRGWDEGTKAAQRRYDAKVLAWANEEKVKRGCARCGYRESPYALEFDHIIPRRLTGEKPIWAARPSSVKEALMNPNIQVLCANCHAIKSVGERRLTLTIDPS